MLMLHSINCHASIFKSIQCSLQNNKQCQPTIKITVNIPSMNRVIAVKRAYLVIIPSQGIGWARGIRRNRCLAIWRIVRATSWRVTIGKLVMCWSTESENLRLLLRCITKDLFAWPPRYLFGNTKIYNNNTIKKLLVIHQDICFWNTDCYLETGNISMRLMHIAKRLVTEKKPHNNMAATARVIWLCACVRYWSDRGLVFEWCFYCWLWEV